MTPQTQAGAFMGLGVITSAFQGIGEYQSGQSEKAAYDYNAEVVLANMRNKMVASQEQYSELVGKQASAYARAGVDITSGSPLLIMATTAGRGGREAAQIEQQGTEEATLQRYYGKIAAFKGTFGGIGSFLKGVTSSAVGYLKATGKPYPQNIPTTTGP